MTSYLDKALVDHHRADLTHTRRNGPSWLWRLWHHTYVANPRNGMTPLDGSVRRPPGAPHH
jgi:hypothetical protein